MSQQKTKPTPESVADFIGNIGDEEMRDDCSALVEIMRNVTKSDPVLWAGNIIGFGEYHYKYESGHQGYACLTGFSPRKQNISLYIMPGYSGHNELIEKLGKHKAGKGCLYVKRLRDIDVKVLEEIIHHSVTFLKQKYPEG